MLTDINLSHKSILVRTTIITYNNLCVPTYLNFPRAGIPPHPSQLEELTKRRHLGVLKKEKLRNFWTYFNHFCVSDTIFCVFLSSKMFFHRCTFLWSSVFVSKPEDCCEFLRFHLLEVECDENCKPRVYLFCW